MKYTDSELRTLIIDRFSAPHHRCSPNTKWKGAKSWDVRSESCSDHLKLTVSIVDNKIQNACFEGHACTVAIASADLILEKVIGQDVKNLSTVIDQYNKLVNQGIRDGSELNEKNLGKLIAFKNIYRQKNRRACALLITNGLNQLLNDDK